MADVDSKTCNGCDELKPASDFRERKTKGRKTYTSGTCRTCEATYHRERVEIKKQNPTWRHARWITNLKSKYSITKEQYIDKMLEQDFRCALCLEPQSSWVVDHDHACCDKERSCGSCVRSLLCDNCNKMLGHARDNTATLRRAAEYLEVTSGKS